MMRGLKLATIAVAVTFVGFVAMPAQVSAQPATMFAPAAPAAIFTQVAYSDEDAMLIIYHVLRPGPFFTSTQTGVVYRFLDDATGEGCVNEKGRALKPVFRENEILNDSTPFFTNPEIILDERSDFARRSVTDVFFLDGCPNGKNQPRSEEEILELEDEGEVELVPDADIVNAASVPSPKMRSDWDLWEAPAGGFNVFDGSPSAQSNAANAEIGDIVLSSMVRPRHKGFAGGKSMWYITYEVCSDEQWSDTGFCSGDGVKDIFFVRYGPSHSELDMTNIAFGIPFPKAEVASGNSPKSGGNYSPIWRGQCVGGLHDGGDRGFDGTDHGVGPPANNANCFGPTPEELKAFTSANDISLTGDDDLDDDDPRRGGQVRSSADFSPLIEGGFFGEMEPLAAKIKIINCPITASDLNQDRKFTADEMIIFPNHVLEANRNGEFTVFNAGGPSGE